MKKAFDIKQVKELNNELVTFGCYFPSFYLDNDLDKSEWKKVKDFCRANEIQISSDLKAVRGKRDAILKFLETYYYEEGVDYSSFYFEVEE